MRGRFIVFEGIEGSGKTTQKDLLAEWLESRGIAHVVTREPGGTALGEGVRRLLLHGDPVASRPELLLYLAARAQLVTHVVAPALEAGRVVVTDRYEMSTFAYQGAGRGLDLGRVRMLNDFATTGLRPDLTIVLALPRPDAVARMQARARDADRIEGAGIDFHDRVAAAYESLIRSEPNVEAVDGRRPPERVHDQVVQLLQQRFPETFLAGPG